ncbi:MAG: SPOR domain-containing protein [Capnocytophaga sp.]|nr:SPOR domain-containing protein [Capnocytophaga sp.]
MKELSVYVEELLYNHQCVIIPKFGAFISNRKSARLFEDKSFAPPKRELTFNSSLTSNDGLLIKHISETSEVSYEEAENFVTQTVENWKGKLQENEVLTLHNIGILKHSAEGRTVFEASEDVNFLTESFGMSTFVPHEVTPEAPKPETPVAESVAETATTTPTESNIKSAPKKSKGLLKYAAIAVIGLSALGYGAYTYLNMGETAPVQEIAVAESEVQEGVEQRLSEATFFNSQPVMLPPASISLNKVAKKETPTATENKVSDDKPKEAAVKETPKEAAKTADKKEPSTTKTAETKSGVSASDKALASKKYHLIAGSFKDEKNAKARVAHLRKKGFPDAVIVGRNKNGLYQVSYAGFDDITDADRLKQKIKDTQNLDGWVLTNQ